MSERIGWIRDKVTGRLSIVHFSSDISTELEQQFIVLKAAENMLLLTRIIDGPLNLEIDDKNIQSYQDRIEPYFEWSIIDRSSIPQDRTFRNAWTQDQQNVTVDLEKAREIHMKRLKMLRKSQFKVLDEAYIRALELNDTPEINRVTALKQQLRNMPQNEDLSSITDLDALKSYQPGYLAGDVLSLRHTQPDDE